MPSTFETIQAATANLAQGNEIATIVFDNADPVDLQTISQFCAQADAQDAQVVIIVKGDYPAIYDLLVQARLQRCVLNITIKIADGPETKWQDFIDAFLQKLNEKQLPAFNLLYAENLLCNRGMLEAFFRNNPVLERIELAIEDVENLDHINLILQQYANCLKTIEIIDDNDPGRVTEGLIIELLRLLKIVNSLEEIDITVYQCVNSPIALIDLLKTNRTITQITYDTEATDDNYCWFMVEFYAHANLLEETDAPAAERLRKFADDFFDYFEFENDSLNNKFTLEMLAAAQNGLSIMSSSFANDNENTPQMTSILALLLYFFQNIAEHPPEKIYNLDLACEFLKSAAELLIKQSSRLATCIGLGSKPKNYCHTLLYFDEIFKKTHDFEKIRLIKNILNHLLKAAIKHYYNEQTQQTNDLIFPISGNNLRHCRSAYYTACAMPVFTSDTARFYQMAAALFNPFFRSASATWQQVTSEVNQYFSSLCCDETIQSCSANRTLLEAFDLFTQTLVMPQRASAKEMFLYPAIFEELKRLGGRVHAFLTKPARPESQVVAALVQIQDRQTEARKRTAVAAELNSEHDDGKRNEAAAGTAFSPNL